MKIATWNVTGIRARHSQVLAWLQSERPEAACLQEIKALPTQVPAALCEIGDFGFPNLTRIGEDAPARQKMSSEEKG